MAENKNRKKIISIAVLCCIAAFLVGMSIWIGVLSSKEKALDDELGKKQEELTLILEENAALEAIINEENVSVLMQENAHANNYIFADERVYILE